MIKDNYKYGIMILPDDSIPYKDGYRYGAYKESLTNKRDTHITEFFKTKQEVQIFVNSNREYGK